MVQEAYTDRKAVVVSGVYAWNSVRSLITTNQMSKEECKMHKISMLERPKVQREYANVQYMYER